jgi:hypothetical protein
LRISLFLKGKKAQQRQQRRRRRTPETTTKKKKKKNWRNVFVIFPKRPTTSQQARRESFLETKDYSCLLCMLNQSDTIFIGEQIKKLFVENIN